MRKEVEELLKEYNELKGLNLSFNLARGKPNKEQLDLSNGLLDIFDSGSNFTDEAGLDVRNYGEPTGIKEAKELFGVILDIDPDDIVLWGNSSLHGIFEFISRSYTHGVNGSTPWSKLNEVKWLCPVPGYDRHFAMTDYFGFEMINIPMDGNGPDMDLVEQYVKDPQVKGIWCVPKYSNPTGIIYSDEVVRRFARLKPAAKDFRIYWDNTYISQLSFEGKEEHVLNIFDECKKVGSEDIVYLFASTSKMTFPGSGVSALGCSIANKKDYLAYLSCQLICFDKLNQLRHALFLKDKNVIHEHMVKHAAILKPRFEIVLNAFEKELKGLATWTKPTGGYFVSLYVPGKAKEVIAKCKEMGVIMTPAGVFYPYGIDPDNSHIRISPTYLELDELEMAVKVICLAVKLVCEQ